MLEQRKRIKVVDSVMGSGKTTAAINRINHMGDDERVLFVTPFLTECNRIAESCQKREFVTPSEEQFGTKGRHFKWLLEHECNVVCTHALFTYIDDEILDMLKVGNYTLILDEVLDVISQYDIHKYIDRDVTSLDKERCIIKDMNALQKTGFVTVDDDYLVHWSDDEEKNLTNYTNMKNLCDRGLLYYVNNASLFWSFPPEVFSFDIFEEIIILTYLFEYQTQAYYFRFHNIPYDYYHVETVNGILDFVPTEDLEHEHEWKRSIAGLINICDNHKLNDIGNPYTANNNQEKYSALSYTWYAKHDDKYSEVARRVHSFLRKAPPEKRMYTTFKEYKKKVVPKKTISTNAFVSVNARATNDYAERTQCAYLVNRYMRPALKQLFNNKGIHVDEDKYALSEMVQWIWRSAIRNGEPINLYIPSARMRVLFRQWLNNEEVHYETFKSKYF